MASPEPDITAWLPSGLRDQRVAAEASHRVFYEHRDIEGNE
jgi:hypothetical protein